MSPEVRIKVIYLFLALRTLGEDHLQRFADADIMAEAERRGIPYGPLSRLQDYARCRAWSLRFRRQGQSRMARREAAKAGAEARYFRSL